MIVNGITGRPSGGGNEAAGPRQERGYINVVELIPVAGIRILLRDRRVRRATNLDGQELRVTAEGANTVITMPRLDRYDLISVELG